MCALPDNIVYTSETDETLLFKVCSVWLMRVLETSTTAELCQLQVTMEVWAFLRSAGSQSGPQVIARGNIFKGNNLVFSLI